MKNKDKLVLGLMAEKEGVDVDIDSVILAISRNDTMGIVGEEKHYFGVGLSGLHGITNALSSAGKEKSQIRNILDFGSGYGRILRFLKAYFPDAGIVVSDIEEKAIGFCNKTFGVESVLSNKDFENIYFDRKFDLIWCGSLFTHIGRKRFEKLLNFLLDNLENDGMLVFTTHGSMARNRIMTGKMTYGLSRFTLCYLLIQYGLLGYGYADYPRYVDYGISFIRPSWIMNLLRKDKEAKIVSVVEHFYDNHQDIIACTKA